MKFLWESFVVFQSSLERKAGNQTMVSIIDHMIRTFLTNSDIFIGVNSCEELFSMQGLCKTLSFLPRWVGPFKCWIHLKGKRSPFDLQSKMILIKHYKLQFFIINSLFLIYMWYISHTKDSHYFPNFHKLFCMY